MTSSLLQTSEQKPFNPAVSGNVDCSSVALGVDVENTFAQVWQNHPSLIHLDLLSPKGSPRFPEMLLSPAFQASGPKAFLLSSPEPLLTLLSINRNSPNSPAGPPQMCFVPTLEDNGQDVADPSRNPSPLWHGYSAGDCQGASQSLFYEQHSNGESAFHAHATMISQEPDHTTESSALNQACDGSQMQTIGTVEEGMRIQTLWHISQHAALVNQATRLQKRVLAMLGEHASRHCSHQLEGWRNKVLEVSYRPKPPMASGDLFTHTGDFNAVEMQEEEEDLRRILRYPRTHGQSLNSRELQNLARCGRAVLHGVLESLDSDATVSSSSDDEWDHEDARGTSEASQCHGYEWRWLKDRAELCSRWSWLQMRLTELHSQIQQLGELHQQILASKGHVVLAESQPLTDRQVQHRLWTETMDLSFTAGNMQDLSSDLDMEPSSPTRLLRNIERQSAQLTQIVNSLMSPLCASPSSSPVSKGPCSRWSDHQKTTCNSHVRCLPNGSQRLGKAGQKKKRVCHRRQCPNQVDVTYVSARTRPLLTYHKPRLFVMDSPSNTEQVLDSFSLCPRCESSDHATVCTDPKCLRRKESMASKVHPVLSLSSDTPLSLHVQNALCGENSLQRSFLLKTDLFRPQHCLSARCRVSRPLFHCNHRSKNSRHLKGHRRESTPIRWTCTQNHQRKTHRKGKRMRHCSEWPTDGTHWSDVFCLSDENLVEECSEETADGTPTRQRNSQFPLHRKSNESIFSIDDICIPVSLVAALKMERCQYKDILTPSWRKVDISPLLIREEDEQNEGVSELITDEDLSQRHQSYEHKEKLHWPSRSQSRTHRHRIRSYRRSCSGVSVRDHPAHCHPPVDAPVPSTRTSSPPEHQTEASVVNREPLSPWKRRMFPLSDEDEEALRLLPEHQSTTFWLDQEITSR